MVRHRPSSWAMESTRYVNYAKRFGIQYIIPQWFDENDKKLLLNDGIVNSVIEYPGWEGGNHIFKRHDEVVKVRPI